MRSVVRAIIIKDDSLLVIKRVKNNETYWVFPGGGVEDGEDQMGALKRECKEELGVVVEVFEIMFEYPFINKEFGEQHEYFYRCDIISGKIGTGDGPEYNNDSKYNGTYEPCWIKLNEVSNVDLRPLEIKDNILSQV